VQADNIELKVGSGEALDRFGYVSDNPVSRNDPTGHETCTDRWDDQQQKMVHECHQDQVQDDGTSHNPNCDPTAMTCFNLSAEEMKKFSNDLGLVNLPEALTLDVAGVLGIAAARTGAQEDSSGQLVLTMLGAGSLIPAAPVIAGAGLIVGVGSTVASWETGAIQSNISQTEANASGGTVSITSYGGLGYKYTITTSKGPPLSSYSVTSITPALVFGSTFARHLDWFSPSGWNW
jgi:hypothetical protein